MSTNLELILNKVTNENIEINCRAMSNLLNKISNNLVSLELIDDITGYKFLFSLTKWLSIFLGNYQQYKYDPTLIINVLNLYLKCLDVFPPSATQNLKKDFKISSLINDIGSINTELSNLCDQIQHSLSRNAIELITGKSGQRNIGVNNSPEKEFYSYGNSFNNNNFYQSTGNYNNIDNTNTNNFLNYTQPNGFRGDNMNIKISNVNNTVNFNYNNKKENLNSNNNNSFQEVNSLINNSNIISNNNNIINGNIPNINYNNNFNTISSNQIENNNNNINKNIKSSPLVNPSLIILHENIGDNTSKMMSKTMSKISREEIVNFNSQPQQKNTNKNKSELNPTFNKIVMPQQEEQFIFDIGISLKYGDSVQIYHSFNIFYTQILNDIPIEYLFYCDEIIKSICGIMEKCDFLEFGVLC